MTQPTAYSRPNGATFFTNWSTNNPSLPHQGDKLDADLQAVKTSIDTFIAKFLLFWRDDDTFRDGFVRRAALHESIAMGVGTPEAWAIGTAYAVIDSVIDNYKWYWCNTAHTSGATLAADASKWTLIYDFTAFAATLGLGNTTPAALGGAAAAGVAVTASRSDHVHDVAAITTGLAALRGEVALTVNAGTTQAVVNSRVVITAGQINLPSLDAGQFVVVELDPAANVTVTVARPAGATINGNAGNQYYIGDGYASPVMIYTGQGGNAIKAKIEGVTP